MNNGNGGLDELVAALDDLMKHDPAAREFELRAPGTQIERVEGGWVVPVWYGASDVDAYRLSRELDRLQQQLESKTRQQISIILGEGLAPAA